VTSCTTSWSAAALLLAAGLVITPAADGQRESAPSARQDQPRAIRATFAERSYAPGERAVLTIRTGAPVVSLQLFHAGPERTRTPRRDLLTGVPVTRPRLVAVDLKRVLRVPVGSWPSGLYYARLEADGGYLGFAPVVVRPRVLGASRVAVVLPTNTWQAYNFRDVDKDGVGDTWYADPKIPCVDLSRPYLDRGVPSLRIRGFLRWFEHGGRKADFLSDDDLDSVASGAQLARRYDLVVFASHEEYVTTHAYDVTRDFRDLGGNLAFLSANTFYARVSRRGRSICLTGLWKDLGRVDATLTGVHFIGWWRRHYPSRPYVARGVARAPWFFRGTGLRSGDPFGARYGVEIDTVTSDSPPGTLVLADMRDIFGPGRTATMTYYETVAGAKVFAAGAMGFESPQTPVHRMLLDNLWEHLRRP
jgi:hypothetical protein